MGNALHEHWQEKLQSFITLCIENIFGIFWSETNFCKESNSNDLSVAVKWNWLVGYLEIYLQVD